MFFKKNKNQKIIEKSTINDLQDYFNVELSSSQIDAANAMFNGDIVDLDTGEGKTFSILLTASVLKEQTFIVSSNSFLSERDFNFSKDYFDKIGKKSSRLSANTVFSHDVIFCTSIELSDMILSLQQNPSLYNKIFDNKKLNIIVDEIDVIVVDLGSSPFYSSSEKKFDDKNISLFEKMIKYVSKNEYTIEPDTKEIYIEENSLNKILNNLDIDLFDIKNADMLYQFTLYIKALYVLQKDVDYFVSNEKIVVIDPVLKLPKKGFRYIGGLHQYVEYKENLSYTNVLFHNNSITMKEVFNLFSFISGCSATAKYSQDTIYAATGKNVVSIKPFFTSNRKEHDVIFLTKTKCLHKEIDNIIEKKLFKKSNIIMFQNQSELESFAKNTNLNDFKKTMGLSLGDDYSTLLDVGMHPSTVLSTISAGRGIHIDVSNEVKENGGINIILVGAFDSERALHQAKGRIGRRSSPGEKYELVSLQDSVLVEYGGSSLKRILKFIKNETECHIEGKMYKKLYMKAMKEYSGKQLEALSLLYSYDEIISKQREGFFATKKMIEDDKNFELGWLKKMVKKSVETLANEDLDFHDDPYLSFNTSLHYNVFNKTGDENSLTKDIDALIETLSNAKFLKKEVKKLSFFLLNNIWNEHYEQLITLKEGIYLRSLNNKDPFSEFKRESYHMYTMVSNRISRNLVENLIGLMVSTLKTLKSQEK